MAHFVDRRRFVGFLSSIAATMTAVACKLTDKANLASDKLADDDFDYIVVGSGAGGGPLAVNLSKAGLRVLLLEAGSDQGNREVYQIPAFHPIASEDPEISWDFYVKHFDDDAKDQQDIKYVKDKRGILYPRAGTLGGCTAHNAMISVYQHSADWNKMGEDVGDPTYNATTMRQYFGLVENATYLSDPYRKRGWLQIRFASSFLVIGDNAVKSMLIAASRSLKKGLFRSARATLSLGKLVAFSDTNTIDPARDTTEGLALVPLATSDKNRRRCVREYIVENANSNLVVRTNCFVTKLTFDESANIGKDVVVTGVEYEYGEKLYKANKEPRVASGHKNYAKARREVILAGGTFNTPQILMLSGIGPQKELEEVAKGHPEFRVRLDLPGVGKNMQDRYELGVIHASEKPIDLVKDCKFQAHTVDNCYNLWKDHAEGAYTSNGGVVAILKKSKPELVSPDLFIFLLPSEFVGYVPGYSKRIAQSKHFTTWAILKAHTHNRGGYVKLRSLDPFETPEINFRYYEDGTTAGDAPIRGNTSVAVDDLEAMVTGIEFVRSIANDANNIYDLLDHATDTIPELIVHAAGRAPYFQESLPGAHLTTRSQLREWARRNSWGHHACGTCKMGKSSDPMAVVDNKFRVIGAKNLRIVDASIFPRIPGYFIVSSIYTISERATDEILKDAGKARRVQLY